MPWTKKVGTLITVVIPGMPQGNPAYSYSSFHSQGFAIDYKALHKIEALLHHCNNFVWYKQHHFAPQLYVAFYQGFALALVAHFTGYLVANAM
jgi:hypothetical protein